MTLNSGLLSSATSQWRTPPDLVAEIAAFLGEIDLDPCGDSARPLPASASLDGTPGLDGLVLPWQGRVYMNPPYGRQIGLWVHRFCTQPISEGVALIPARTDARWFQEFWAYPICFIAGRLKFSGQSNSAPFPSCLVYRGPRMAEFAAALAHRGHVARPS